MFKVVSYEKWNSVPDIFTRFKQAQDVCKSLDDSYIIEDWTSGRAKVCWRNSRRRKYKGGAKKNE